MNRSMIRNAAILTAVTMLAAAACKKDSNDPTGGSSSPETKMVKDIAADTIVGLVGGQPVGTGKYTFFSLEKNMVIPSSDSASTKWDIALAGTTILVNNTTSGPGQGGAFVWTGVFDNLKTIPADSTFKTDNGAATPKVYAITKGSGKGWYNYDFATSLVTPIPGRVLVIRTASGKYAKVEILNYYKGGVTPPASASDVEKYSKQNYYTFKFVLQPNGSKQF
jgi:HmuY protein